MRFSPVGETTDMGRLLHTIRHGTQPAAELVDEPFAEAKYRAGRLYLCGTLVA
jgi:hypothetical protein